ncbi:MAG: DUF4167 domain-containing protein [Pseudomonadota bacterium]
MRSSNKSRSRNKNNNRNRNVGNIVNRVFDSAGPEGKVRGTPQQIIEKYQGLARDAQLSGDRVAAENFQQHSEHYARMLSDALREQAERQAAEERRRQQQGGGEPRPNGEAQPAQQSAEGQGGEDVINNGGAGGADLVETPEENAQRAQDNPEPRPRRRRRASADQSKSDGDGGSEAPASDAAPEASENAAAAE